MDFMNFSGLNFFIRVIGILLFLKLLYSPPDFIVNSFKEIGTDENIREIKISSSPCNIASLEELKKNMLQLNPNNANNILFRAGLTFFEDGFYVDKKFYKVEGLAKKQDFIEKLGFNKFCINEIDFDDRSKNNLDKIETLKSNYDKVSKNEVEEFGNSFDFIDNISKIEEQIKDENVLKVYKNKLRELDYTNTDDVDNLIKQMKILQKRINNEK